MQIMRRADMHRIDRNFIQHGFVIGVQGSLGAKECVLRKPILTDVTKRRNLGVSDRTDRGNVGLGNGTAADDGDFTFRIHVLSSVSFVLFSFREVREKNRSAAQSILFHILRK